MYYLKKRMEIAAAHKLTLDYESKCQNLHGHNWIVTVYCKAEQLNPNGMIADFTDIKKIVHGALDHQYINDAMSLNPTAENISKWVCKRIHTCYKVEVQESEGNVAYYLEEGSNEKV